MALGDQPQHSGAQSMFSPDGLWWWDGAQWRPAISPDRRWRWDGRSWVPFGQPATRGGGGGTAAAVIITVLAFGGILAFVGIVVVVVLLTMANQMANVFSNVAAALTSTPSP